MKCEHCDIIDRKSKADILYEDEEVVVAIKDLAATPGQITIFPKEHFTILEVVPDEVLKKCVSIANKAGIAVFESLGSQGTNIIIQNGLGAGQKVPHFAIEVLPRVENDGSNLQWEPKQLAEDEMETAFMAIEKSLQDSGQEKSPEESKESGGDETVPEDKDNYLIKSLRKIP